MYAFPRNAGLSVGGFAFGVFPSRAIPRLAGAKAFGSLGGPPHGNVTDFPSGRVLVYDQVMQT